VNHKEHFVIINKIARATVKTFQRTEQDIGEKMQYEIEIPKSLHNELKKAAKEKHLTLQQYLDKFLEAMLFGWINSDKHPGLFHAYSPRTRKG
jgi:hypothetical protein